MSTAADHFRAALRAAETRRARCRPSERGGLDREIAELRNALADPASLPADPPAAVDVAERVAALGLDPAVALAGDVVVPFVRPARRHTRGGAR